ncbi:MAG: response regulator, partial [Deltaproteobacteria bacterium]|nr:response regulator [Deltaproteobacteria bacterium]
MVFCDMEQQGGRMDTKALVESILGGEEARQLYTRRILAVDDDSGNLAILEDLLEDCCDIRIAGSGLEALALFEDGDFDLVLSDQRMPGMTGVELLAKIRDRSPD